MSEEHPQFEPDADFFSNPESFVEPEPLDAFPPIEEESFVPPVPPPYAATASEAAEGTTPPRHTPKPAPVVAGDKPGAPWGLISLGILGAALAVRAYLGFASNDKPETAAAPTPTSPPPSVATTDAPKEPVPVPTPTAVLPASSDEHKALVAKFDDLSKAVDALQARLDGMPKPAPAPDLKPIETKIAALDTKVADLAAKPAPAPTTEPAPMVDIKPIEGKVDGLAKTVAGLAALKDQVTTLSERLSAQDKTIAALKTASTEKPAASANGTSPMPTTPASSTPAADIEGALTQAANLFKGNQFGPARDAFVKLQATAPNDARVWYFAAMSNGFATNQWEGGDTLAFVTKGIEREKAGTPNKAKLDAAFADLNANAKGWLDAYRAQAR